ncbi:MAG: tetratricopeptide repeat protein [Candidatus Fibromonas sp.]|nr:tetratricopeptide repeat protein [Candidatus Fibromonas sp.]
MRINFFLLVMVVGVQAVFAAKQTVAVLPSDGLLNANELDFFTNKAQEIAVKTLPKSNFEVFPQEVVFKRLGGVDSYVKECKEVSCIVELGRKAMVDYVAQCRFGKFGSDLTVTFELYQVSTSGLIDKFVESAKNINSLRTIMEKKIPDSFMKIPGAVPIGGEISEAKNDAEAYYKRGIEYEEKEDYDKAVSDFNEAIRLNPNYAAAYYWRGNVYGKKGDRHRAIADYESALRIDPSHSNAQKALSEARNALESKTASPPVASSISDVQTNLQDGRKYKTASPLVASSISDEVLTDLRDGRKYEKVKIGSQTWMAENLNYNASGSKCYGNKPENCEKYGRLYDWNTAINSCPSGWHLPRKSEYEVLDKAVGGEKVAGKKLKAKSGWNRRVIILFSGNGTDEFGFSALPGGNGYSDGSFGSVGDNGDWWSANEYNSSRAYYRGMGYIYDSAYWGNRSKSSLFSVRCVQD